MLSQLIQRLRGARAQRRLFTGDRGAIAASLVEIGVAMLAVGILTAGALTTFTGFIGRVSDTSARNTLSDAVTISDSVYNWLRTGGERCYDDTDCSTVTSATMATAMQEEAGGEISFEQYDNGDLTDSSKTGIVLVNVDTLGTGAAAGTPTSATGGGYMPAGSGKHFIQLAIRSDSGASFCVLKITKADAANAEGLGYMSVNQTDTNANSGKAAAHCGAQQGSSTPADRRTDSALLCVFGPGGAYSVDAATGAGTVKTGTALAACATTASPTKPGASKLDHDHWS